MNESELTYARGYSLYASFQKFIPISEVEDSQIFMPGRRFSCTVVEIIPLQDSKDVKHLLVPITSDRGLCGGVNRSVDLTPSISLCVALFCVLPFPVGF